MELKQRVDDLMDYAITERRYLHENPELTGKEFNTSKYLKQRAIDLGLEIEEIPCDDISTGTGFLAILDTGRPGKTLGLRADIDALPIQETENNLTNKRVVKSKVDGVMHACGHDGHMSTLLSVMKILVDMKDELSGTIIFIFEEGEESSTGIYSTVDYLKSKNMDAIYGNHLYSGLPTGKVAVCEGPLMSASLRIQMFIKGRGGHVSRPDLSVNPVVAAAYIVTNLAGAYNNQLPVDEMVTFGFSQIKGSDARNVIADEAFLGGSIRYFNEDAGAKAFEMIKNVSTLVAQAHQCEVRFSEDSGPSAASVINSDTSLVSIGQDVVNELFPESLIDSFQWYASESFGHYKKVCPTLFTLVGTGNKAVGSGAEHHNEYFDLDEESLRYAIGTMAGFAVEYLSE